MKHSRTKATDISPEIKQIVHERDQRCCVLCSRPGDPWCHYIGKAQGGLGVPENVVTLCPECHSDYDNGDKREVHGQLIRHYLDHIYPGFPDEDRIYQKWPEELRV